MTNEPKTLKKTPLNQEHKKLNAKMVDFGGWEMPVQYTSVIDEHQTTRTCAGLFDICHMGEIRVSGKNAYPWLQSLIAGNLDKLIQHKAMYTFMLNENGGTIDEALVYMHTEEEFFLVVNSGPAKKDADWVKSRESDGVKVEDISDQWGKLDLQGPRSQNILSQLTSLDLWNLPRFGFINTTLAGRNAWISRTGYTGEDGFEIYCAHGDVLTLWTRILYNGVKFGLKPVGLGARDTLRLESCFCLYGHELTEEISPLEAGLGWAVDLSKDNFIGLSALKAQKAGGIPRKIVAFEMKKRAIPRCGYEVWADGRRAGIVTSGSFSPTFNKPIGLALLQSEFIGIGREVDILIRDHPHPAVQVKKPFYLFNGKAS